MPKSRQRCSTSLSSSSKVPSSSSSSTRSRAVSLPSRVLALAPLLAAALLGAARLVAQDGAVGHGASRQPQPPPPHRTAAAAGGREPRRRRRAMANVGELLLDVAALAGRAGDALAEAPHELLEARAGSRRRRTRRSAWPARGLRGQLLLRLLPVVEEALEADVGERVLEQRVEDARVRHRADVGAHASPPRPRASGRAGWPPAPRSRSRSGRRSRRCRRRAPCPASRCRRAGPRTARRSARRPWRRAAPGSGVKMSVMLTRMPSPVSVFVAFRPSACRGTFTTMFSCSAAQVAAFAHHPVGVGRHDLRRRSGRRRCLQISTRICSGSPLSFASRLGLVVIAVDDAQRRPPRGSPSGWRYRGRSS